MLNGSLENTSRNVQQEKMSFHQTFKRNTKRILAGDSLKISVPRATTPAFLEWHAEFGEGGNQGVTPAICHRQRRGALTPDREHC